MLWGWDMISSSWLTQAPEWSSCFHPCLSTSYSRPRSQSDPCQLQIVSDWSPGEKPPISLRSLQSLQWSARSGPYPCSYFSPPCTFLSSLLAVHTPNSGSFQVLSSLPGTLFPQLFAKWLASPYPSDFCSSVTFQVRSSQHSLCS